MKTKLIFACIAFVITGTATAQSPVGKWKMVANEITDANGEVTDVVKEIPKSMPCLANVTQEFLANGTAKSIVPDDCGAMKAAVEKMNKSTRWVMNGNKITVTSDEIKKDLTSTAIVTFQGDRMIWTIEYTEKDFNPSKVKRARIVYKRI